MAVNRFVHPIMIKSKKHDFKAWLKLIKIRKELRKTSPSFDMMMEMHEAVEIFRDCFLYANTLPFVLCKIDKKNRSYGNAKAFGIVKDRLKIIVLLGDDNRITIEINMFSGDDKNLPSTTDKISFISGEYEIKNEYEEAKFQTIISLMMSEFENLIVYEYKNKMF